VHPGGSDPFAVIECEAPVFGEDRVRDIVRRHYGLAGELKPLLSERDQNFRLRTDDGRDFVLKIANAAEAPEATDFQIRALLYLEPRLGVPGSPVCVPRVQRTVDGQSHVLVTADGTTHVTRMVSYLAGIPLGKSPVSPLLCRRIGAALAHLGQALRDFTHPASRHGLLWDMQQALELRRILRHIGDAAMERLVAATLDDFETYALPRFPALRSQVIHSDLNPENLLIRADDPDAVAGIIDFGDMLHAPLIVDVAIGASYLRATSGDPFAGIGEYLAGYHAVTPLTLDEIDLLTDLIRTRLAASIAILAWRASLRGADDPYLAGAVASEGNAAQFLRILSEVPREHAQRTLRQVCASA